MSAEGVRPTSDLGYITHCPVCGRERATQRFPRLLLGQVRRRVELRVRQSVPREGRVTETPALCPVCQTRTLFEHCPSGRGHARHPDPTLRRDITLGGA